MSDFYEQNVVSLLTRIAESLEVLAAVSIKPAPEPPPEPEPEPEPEPMPGPGTVGITKPATRVVAGTNGVLKITEAGKTYSQVEFRCRVDVEAENVEFRDCLFSGASEMPENSALLRTISGKGSAVAVHCTFDPRVPQVTVDGIRGSNLSISFCEITRTVDGIHIYGNLSDPDDPRAGRVAVKDTWIHDLSTFQSTSHSDGWTHNDAVQIVGGSDCTFHRVRFSGQMRNAAFMVNPTKQPIDRLQISSCWFENESASGVNIANADPLHDLVITDNVFPKAWDGKRYPMLVSSVTLDQGTYAIERNSWDDGSLPGPAVKRG